MTHEFQIREARERLKNLAVKLSTTRRELHRLQNLALQETEARLQAAALVREASGGVYGVAKRDIKAGEELLRSLDSAGRPVLVDKDGTYLTAHPLPGPRAVDPSDLWERYSTSTNGVGRDGERFLDRDDFFRACRHMEADAHRRGLEKAKECLSPGVGYGSRCWHRQVEDIDGEVQIDLRILEDFR